MRGEEVGEMKRVDEIMEEGVWRLGEIREKKGVEAGGIIGNEGE